MSQLVLHQFGADVGTESASPFCVKVHRALGHKKLAYRVSNLASPAQVKRVNPTYRKLPVLEVDGVFIADSTKILEFLDKKYSDNPIWSDTQPWFSGLLEDWADESLYWYVVYYRWQVESNFKSFANRAFGKLPLPLRWIVPKFARKQVLAMLAGQGIGRSPESTVRSDLAVHLQRLDRVLSENPWMSGAALGAADLAVFPLVRQLSIENSIPQTRPLVIALPRLTEWMIAVDRATTTAHTCTVTED